MAQPRPYVRLGSYHEWVVCILATGVVAITIRWVTDSGNWDDCHCDRVEKKFVIFSWAIDLGNFGNPDQKLQKQNICFNMHADLYILSPVSFLSQPVHNRFRTCHFSNLAL